MSDNFVGSGWSNGKVLFRRMISLSRRRVSALPPPNRFGMIDRSTKSNYLEVNWGECDGRKLAPASQVILEMLFFAVF